MTEGQRQLRLALRSTTYRALALRLRVGTTTVWRWANGERRPERWVDRERLRRVLGIDPASWDRWALARCASA